MFTSSITETSKNITFSEFNAFLQSRHEKAKGAKKSIMEDTAFLLKNSGYSLTLTEIDCSKLPMYLYQYLVNDFHFRGISFNQCKLPRNASFERCTFINSDFLDTGQFSDAKNCLFYTKDKASFDALIKMGFRIDDGNITLCINDAMLTPLIGVVYFRTHGTAHTNSIIDILSQHSILAIKMDENFLSHPIAKDMSLFDGIILPGGLDLITDPAKYSEREKLESFLVTAALEHKIPTLGVCRGHQFLGHYFGAEIKSVRHHWQCKSTIHVPRDNNKLFALTDKKFSSQTRKRKRTCIYKEDDGYKYQSECIHSQGVFFKELPPPEKKVKITAKADDGLPESLQIDEHIISFQHHHEDRQADSIAKASMRMFLMMVIEYHEKKQGVKKVAQPTPTNA